MDTVLGFWYFLVGRIGKNDKGDGWDVGEKMGVKGMTLRAAKQNPISTCTLTFLKQIYMNFSFQLDGIKTHFPCSFFSIKQNTLMIKGLPTTLKRFGVIWQLTGKFLWRNPQRVAHVDFLNCRRALNGSRTTQRVALFQEAFVGLPGIGIGRMIARWKFLWV